MRNKGAILLFAILLALTCVYYLAFTYVASGVEEDAKLYAENYATQKNVVEASKKAYANESMQKIYLDSVQNKRKDYYLDSLKKVTVFDIGITQFTYEDVANQKLNLGLDLVGGMNVTLEVSVIEIVKSLAKNTTDANFNKALDNAYALRTKSTKDFVTLFGEEYTKLSPNTRLASHFQTIELKGKIDYNTTNEEVLKFLREQIEDAIATSENTLRTRIDKFGVTQPNIQRLPASGRILIELPGVTDKERVRKLVQTTASLEFWQTYENKEIFPFLDKANTRLKEILNPKMDSTKTTDTSSVVKEESNKVNTDTGTVKTDGDSASSLLSKLNNKTDSTGLKAGATKADTLAKMKRESPLLFSRLQPMYKFNEQNQPVDYLDGPVVGYAPKSEMDTILAYLNNPKIKSLFPKDLKFAWGFKAMDKEETIYQLIALKAEDREGNASLSGDVIADARQGFEKGHPSVSMQMTSEAAVEWRKLTKDHTGESVAIVLDNVVYSYPTIQGEIPNGSTSITGDFTVKDVTDLINILKAGKLPAPARIVEETVVGPTLGAEATKNGFISTIIALIVVLLFMGFYYSKAGWVADFAMLVNNLYVIGILASFSAVLTLPGIAGIVLTIAMSVDANILIFERVREELRSGKTLSAGIKEGYRHAMPSVIDSHVTGLLLGIILFVFGTGPIQGFATTLIIGTISSMFCAIFITRLIFDRWLGKNKNIAFGNNFTKDLFKKININFVKKRKLYYLLSATIIAAGVFAYFQKGGFSMGVDFKGGRSYVVRFDEIKSTEEIREALKLPFETEPEVKTYGESNQKRITTTYLISDGSEDAETKVEAKLHEGLDKLGTKYQIMSSQKVGETVSRDIKQKSIWAVLLSCLVMFIFIFVRFKKWQYGFGAVVALFHDVAIVLSCYIILDGVLPFSLEITQDFIAAILTVMSYSMTDTVVVFDRIREYLSERNKSDVEGEEKIKVINFALNSTLSRTINTSLTIFFVLLAIFIFGGETIRGFAFALLIGIVIGTYSSLCIATPIVIDLDKKKKSEGDKKASTKPQLQNA